jgi:hypothetical protein
LEDLGIDRIILKWIFYGLRVRIGLLIKIISDDAAVMSTVMNLHVPQT